MPIRETTVTIGLPVAEKDPLLFASVVRSIFAQTHEDWRLVIVLEQPSAEIIQLALAIRDYRVTVVNDGERLGLAARLNQINDLSKTKYIARMDGDDVCHPRRIEAQFEYLEQNADVDVVGVRCYMIDGDDQITGKYNEATLSAEPLSYFKAVPFTHPTVMARSEWCARWKYDQAILRAEDKDLWIRSQASSKFAKLESCLFYYRVPASIEVKKYLRTYSDDRRVIKKLASGRISSLEKNGLLIKSHLKGAVVRISGVVGRTTWLAKQKFTLLTENEQSNALRILETIETTRVPGWDN